MASNTGHVLDLASIIALASPTSLGRIHSSSALPVLVDMPQGRGNPEVDSSREVTLHEARVPTLLSKTRSQTPIRPPPSRCYPDTLTAVVRAKSYGDLKKHPGLNCQPGAKSIDSFSGLRSLQSSSNITLSTRSTALYQTAPGSINSRADLAIEGSKPQLRGGVSPSKQLLHLCRSLFHHEAHYAYLSFLRAYPEYKLTGPIDTLRKREYKRLKQLDEVYVDYTGASLYPESLIRSNSTFLRRTILGNTHSFSTSSHRSAMCTEEARSSVLAFFDAPATEYTVIFTSNATGAMKLVGEAFPFAQGGSFVLGTDSHNSVNGIRQFALTKGARLAYIGSTIVGGMDESEAKNVLLAHSPRPRLTGPRCLFALTGLSNVTNSKNPLSLLTYASNLGYYTLLDAAALAPASKISLRTTPADAMAISFYKMFGFPTGVGCLVAKKSFLRQLERPWFAGGTVDVVQVPGTGFTMAHEIHEQFEDGTVNFSSLAGVTRGLNILSRYIAYLPLRLSILTHYLAGSLAEIKHDVNCTPVAHILSRIPKQRLTAVGEQSDTGSTVSLIFLEPTGEVMSSSFIEYAATKHGISLRTGCMCNPGGAAAILGIEEEMEKFSPGFTYEDFENIVGRELGVIRLSLGLVSDFSDVHRVLRFVREIIACDGERKKIWLEWKSCRQFHG
ncbi:PLP-dependent transferase [Thelephora ganbajun]|uniref:PLP-dependent transferase n=1 Tax=Thelephora ganbajun TaxID=370292 RepID=A0ACB6ZJB0_THEGA|nr:PLP-dependent transferase [Thelephora ganbajun]